ncbi:MAG: hypothetical protein V3V00_06750 [Saprospiraceae bacterium]
MKTNIIATDITTLTDARYFAAWGVDYILYDLNHIGVNEIMAIVEWVEGVKTLVKMDKDNIHLIDEVLIRINPHAVGSSQSECQDRILQYVSEGPIFHDFPSEDNDVGKIIIANVDNIDAQTYQIEPESEVMVFAEINPSPVALNKFLEQNQNVGIILRGSSEVETGLKSFDNMDVLFELLEDQNN